MASTIAKKITTIVYNPTVFCDDSGKSAGNVRRRMGKSTAVPAYFVGFYSLFIKKYGNTLVNLSDLWYDCFYVC